MIYLIMNIREEFFLSEANANKMTNEFGLLLIILNNHTCNW